jgi:hypothetical protein
MAMLTTIRCELLRPLTLFKYSMNSKVIMSASAIMLASIGIMLTFLSTEVLGYLQITTTAILQLLIQILGALFFAFAMLNWMAKGSTIGGIYNRPIAIANFTHFVMGALTLSKVVLNNTERPSIIWLLTSVYVLFAILFGMILFRSPKMSKLI